MQEYTEVQNDCDDDNGAQILEDIVKKIAIAKQMSIIKQSI